MFGRTTQFWYPLTAEESSSWALFTEVPPKDSEYYGLKKKNQLIMSGMVACALNPSS